MEIKESKINEFIKELKRLGVEYDPINKKHWIGSKFICEDKHVITNKQMITMCETYFGREYIGLTYREQKLIREDIFRKLRGEQ